MLRMVVGAHLSTRNNTPELALAALHQGRSKQNIALTIACQDDGFDWMDI